MTVPDPVNYEAHQYYAIGVGWRHMRETPPTMRLDWAIRTAIEHAAYAEEDLVLLQTKALGASALQLQASADGSPVCMQLPSGLQRQEATCQSGPYNARLNDFADTAYHAVVARFGQPTTAGWHIVSYFGEGDDMRGMYNVGLFADDTFCETVVE